jgi:hypothetical protein
MSIGFPVNEADHGLKAELPLGMDWFTIPQRRRQPTK